VSCGRVTIGANDWKRPVSKGKVILEGVDDGSCSVLCSNGDPSTDDGNLKRQLSNNPNHKSLIVMADD